MVWMRMLQYRLFVFGWFWLFTASTRSLLSTSSCFETFRGGRRSHLSPLPLTREWPHVRAPIRYFVCVFKKGWPAKSLRSHNRGHSCVCSGLPVTVAQNVHTRTTTLTVGDEFFSVCRRNKILESHKIKNIHFVAFTLNFVLPPSHFVKRILYQFQLLSHTSKFCIRYL